jgi:recombinational DNA repair protein (RecF pathway)
LENALDAICGSTTPTRLLSCVIAFELEVLALSGLTPDFSGFDEQSEWSAFSIEQGRFSAEGRRFLRITPQVAQCLNAPEKEYSKQILLDAARVIGVFYQFHLDCTFDVRRTALRMISTTTYESGET